MRVHKIYTQINVDNTTVENMTECLMAVFKMTSKNITRQTDQKISMQMKKSTLDQTKVIFSKKNVDKMTRQNDSRHNKCKQNGCNQNDTRHYNC